uniref:Uncharacterized protein n=1 Tax=Taeniopygia guttata TaxID=59729 RepID=A0A674HTF1_TAEGU
AAAPSQGGSALLQCQLCFCWSRILHKGGVFLWSSRAGGDGPGLLWESLAFILHPPSHSPAGIPQAALAVRCLLALREVWQQHLIFILSICFVLPCLLQMLSSICWNLGPELKCNPKSDCPSPFWC